VSDRGVGREGRRGDVTPGTAAAGVGVHDGGEGERAVLLEVPVGGGHAASEGDAPFVGAQVGDDYPHPLARQRAAAVPAAQR